MPIAFGPGALPQTVESTPHQFNIGIDLAIFVIGLGQGKEEVSFLVDADQGGCSDRVAELFPASLVRDFCRFFVLQFCGELIVNGFRVAGKVALPKKRHASSCRKPASRALFRKTH
jgi:hypothetical protein